ncbi:S8 family serine peptidase [Streptomyces avicenniae]|uniref:S8 family serine peptidase n=1 Tax=Streptomyces avicenniae TaxID=500153 RepID=UPI00069BE8F9|nr:S8 family serine peptidase [Streptomyces avicenniae]
MPHLPDPPRRGRGPLLAAVTAALCAGQLAVPGLATPSAAAEPCRTEIVGAELPDAAGPYPLIQQLALRHAWDLSTGTGVTVGVVDSGVDARHPDLDGAVRRGSEYTTVNEERGFDRATPRPEQDCEGHGTALAGLIAGRRADGDRMTGVAPGASVYPVRIAEGVDQVDVTLLAAAIDDAVAAGVGVLNLSFAFPVGHDALRDAVARAVAADVVVVAAAGNEANDTVEEGRMYPAAYEGVIAVTSVDADGQPVQSSNRGLWIDLAGYGENMTVLSPGGSGYRVDSGNSYAAAEVSGAAALVRSLHPDLSAAQVTERLLGSATPVGGGDNDRTGAGIVDPFGALTWLPGSEPAGGGGSGGGRVALADVPEDEPLLSSTAATALAWSGCLLLAVVLGLLGAPALRRAAGRGWRAGPDPAPRETDGHGAAPRPPGSPGPSRPPRPRLDWLDGSDVPAPDHSTTASRNRTR